MSLEFGVAEAKAVSNMGRLFLGETDYRVNDLLVVNSQIVALLFYLDDFVRFCVSQDFDIDSSLSRSNYDRST